MEMTAEEFMQSIDKRYEVLYTEVLVELIRRVQMVLDAIPEFLCFNMGIRVCHFVLPLDAKNYDGYSTDHLVDVFGSRHIHRKYHENKIFEELENFMSYASDDTWKITGEDIDIFRDSFKMGNKKMYANAIAMMDSKKSP